ncbi:regulation of nuclear pre-mRNA domain-containing protein 1A [Morus notabilis]|uniref:regulation of nuclear pre-mRNA domain-containing protein 1A n=1 Tax=Morus notabilis TaxID=981085 RepID=UPI000CECF487|nr:regulation of nuclear pre-mRNA domain-containing protein 1A [Morus notabilis]XP_024023630.1 regulation of nuclear pre-mRNA domain-containing protein 1A [Morus notabilis]XP_024023631.1 regulation of nuclear pre-mRNA domain-containing protein 1A [Morus notabilis]
MNSVFSEPLLAEKLSKVNSTQQSIETISHWCIFHRSKAELVVATWEKQFHSSQMVQKVPLLYLANDILQNSKKNGNEFVTEFWKVLPKALKDVIQKGDERGKKVVSRLVDIWEERRVFGSRARSLKEVILGDEAPPPLELGSKKRTRSVKIVKRDSRSIRTKLSIGGVTEKIVSAFHLVLSEQPNEDAETNKCKSATSRIQKLEKEVETACTRAKDPKRKTLAKELEEEENTLKQCVEKLKLAETSRLALVSQLKEALHEQESELENVQKQMRAAYAQAEEARNMRKRLEDEGYVSKSSSNATTSPADANATPGQAPKKSAAVIAAEVADRLAASSSSQLIMSSVLSTFAAEEAKNAGLTKTSASLSMDSDSIPEKSVSVSDPNVFMSTQSLTAPPSHIYHSVLVPQPAMQNQAPHSQAQYHMLSNPVSQTYMQPGGGVMPPYGYSSIPPLPLPPPLPHMVSPMVPLAQQQPLTLAQQLPPIAQQQTMPLTQQPPIAPSFRPLQPPGIVYYGHPRTSQ